MLEILEKMDTIIEANERNKKQIENIDSQIEGINKEIHKNEEELEVSQNAIELLRGVSEKTINKSYEFIEKTLNDTLARVFTDRKRVIKINETLMKNQYPQVELELTTESGVRSIKDDSGHGIMQIISLLSCLCLIVISGSRKIMVLDEVLSGLSNETMEVLNDILWDFTKIGFQFVINEHGFVPKGAKVYKLKVTNGSSNVESEYIEPNGVYRMEHDEKKSQKEE